LNDGYVPGAVSAGLSQSLPPASTTGFEDGTNVIAAVWCAHLAAASPRLGHDELAAAAEPIFGRMILDHEPDTNRNVVGRVLVWVAIVFVVVLTLPQMLGNLIGRPLERDRDKNTAVWLAWNALRLALPVTICAVSLVYLIWFLTHRL
jgi:hypothetical protein